MERVYKALARLAAIGLVAGLATAALQTFPIKSGSIGYSAAGMSGSLSDWFWIFGYPVVSDAVITLVAGVTVAGMMAAWADRRGGWLIAIFLVTLATIAWPSALHVWEFTHPSTVPPSFDPVAQVSPVTTLATLSVFAAALIPVALVLVFASNRERAAKRVEDASLEVTRSAL